MNDVESSITKLVALLFKQAEEQNTEALGHQSPYDEPP
jgi:hypothetical protein